MDDTDPSIMYIPATDWHASSTTCTQCLIVDAAVAFNQTYHSGTHVTIDEDDLSSTTTATASAPSDTDNDGDEDEPGGEDTDEPKGGGKGGGPSQSRRSLPTSRAQIVHARLDPDDPGFVDTPVTVQFKFNGTAVYLFAIQPQGPPTTPLAPTSMNLSFTLDNQHYPPYLFSSSPTGSGFLPHVNVLSLQGLSPNPHVLLVNIGVNSSFLFDYMVYTTESTLPSNDGNATSPSGSSAPDSISSTTVTATTNTKHDVGTFAGAVAGSLGVVTLFAFGLCLNIYCRRRRSALRERREREMNPESSSGGMIGPRPFVPRYFPGTAPPPYSESRAPSASSSVHDHGQGEHQHEESVHSFGGVNPDTHTPPQPPNAELPSYADSDARTGALVQISSHATTGSRRFPPSTGPIPPLLLDRLPTNTLTLGIGLSYADVPPPTPPLVTSFTERTPATIGQDHALPPPGPALLRSLDPPPFGLAPTQIQRATSFDEDTETGNEMLDLPPGLSPASLSLVSSESSSHYHSGGLSTSTPRSCSCEHDSEDEDEDAVAFEESEEPNFTSSSSSSKPLSMSRPPRPRSTSPTNARQGVGESLSLTLPEFGGGRGARASRSWSSLVHGHSTDSHSSPSSLKGY